MSQRESQWRGSKAPKISKGWFVNERAYLQEIGRPNNYIVLLIKLYKLVRGIAIEIKCDLFHGIKVVECRPAHSANTYSLILYKHPAWRAPDATRRTGRERKSGRAF